MAERKLEIKSILIVAILLLNTFFIVSCKKNGDPNRKTSGSGLNNTSFEGEIVVEDEEGFAEEKTKDGDHFHEGVDEYKSPLQHESGLLSKVSIWQLSEEMVFEYLMSAVPEVSEMVMLHGMALMLENGEDTFIDDMQCRTVWLGTNHEEHFVREILYAIDDYGKVYEYDVLNDKWVYTGN